MAQITIYGNQVSAPPAYMRWKMVYEITETSTTYSVSLVGIIQTKSTNGALHHTINAYLDATGKNQASWSENGRANNLNFPYSEDWKDTTIFSSRTISWNKTHSTQSVSITLTSKSTTGLPSTALSKSFTIPAKPSYTITYNANGGSGAPSAQTKWYGETLTLSSTRPTRTGYTFAGWATSASGSVAYQPSGSYTANSAVTLYAKWNIITYTVSYNANGGTGAPANQTKYYGTNLVLSSTAPTRVGYTFKSWNTKADGTGTTYNAGSTYTGNAALVLYAQWEQVGKVTLYDANGNPHTGRVYLYDENGNKLNCSIWIYDENGNRHYTK